jgi:molybdopterin-binding protein
MTKRKKLRGSVKKVIKSPVPSEPEKAEIVIHEAEDLYKEIRIENVVTDEKGKENKLKEGEDVDLIVETEPNDKKQKS